MKSFRHILSIIFAVLTALVVAQPSNPAPYCTGNYATGTCNQPNASNSPLNSINDFINDFNTTGANVNITNNNSGCNPTGGPTNYYNYSCQHYIQVTPGQTITCNIRSGITYAQGFAMWVDWNQDNVFQNPGERVDATSNVPNANTWTVMAFVVPANQGTGAYRLRVKCAYATSGTGITPCGNYGFGECEDYTLFIGQIPSTFGIVTATATSNSPLCAGQTLSLSVTANATTGLTYTWTGPGSYSSTAQNPVIGVTSLTTSGVYQVVVNNGACPATRTVGVQFIAYPSFQATPATPTICQGGGIIGNASFATAVNPAQYYFSWGPTGAGIMSPLTQGTGINPPLLSTTQSLATMIYSVTVTPTIQNCPTMRTLTLTIFNPLTPTLTMPQPMCNISPQTQLSAVPGGGTWISNSAVGPGGLLSPALASIGTNTVQYVVSMGVCQNSTTGSFSVSRFHTAALSSSLNLVCVQDASHNLLNLVQDTTGKWTGINLSGYRNRNFSPGGLPSGTYSFTYNTWSTPDSMVCPASTILALQVFNPPTPTISFISARCTNEPTVALSANPPGGTWSNNSGISSTGIQTPSLCAPGVNSVTYTAGQGTCVAATSTLFNVSQYRTAALSGPLPDLCSNSLPANLLSIVQNTNGNWSGVNVTNNQFNPVGLPTNTYLLTYFNPSWPDPAACPETSTVAASVLNPPVPEITQIGPICSKDGTVQLTATPSTGYWVPLNYLTASGVFIPSLAAIGNNQVQYVIGTATCQTQQTKFISVEVFVPATITSSLAELCDNSMPVSLSFITQSGSGNWTGPGVQGNNFNPVLTGAGVFTLTYNTASSPNGLCPDKADLAVTVFSLAPPMVAKAGPYCNTAPPAQLTVNPLGGVFGGENTSAVSASGLFFPGHASFGDNVINYSISVGPCIAHTQATINVARFVSAALLVQPADAYCRGTLPFNLNSFAQNPGGHWEGTGVVAGHMFDPAQALTGSNLLVYNTTSFPDGSLCPDSRTLTIRVEDAPLVSIFSNRVKGCSPLEVIFNVGSTSTGKAVWHFGDGSEPQEGYVVNHVYTTPGTYTVNFNLAKGACSGKAELSTPIVVQPAPRADFDFSKSELSISDPEVQLLNRTTRLGENKYAWQIQSVGARSDISPSVAFTKAGLYEVKLTATNYDGCKHEVTRFIEVKNDFGVYMPNSFTPNDDGLNDMFKPVFTPYGLDKSNYQLDIFDRWGHLVFRSNDPEKGWDGSIGNKGEERMKQDVYTYMLRFRDLDGATHHRSGHVSLWTE
jgi:gliding motility-associated-like protein